MNSAPTPRESLVTADASVQTRETRRPALPFRPAEDRANQPAWPRLVEPAMERIDGLDPQQDEPERLRTRAACLYDFAPIGCLTLTATGLIEDMNLAAATLLGASRAKLHQSPFALWVAKADLSGFLEHLRDCRRDCPKVTTKLHLRRPDGAEVRVQLISTRLPVSVGFEQRLYQTVLIDLSESRQVEEALRRSCLLHQVAFEAARVGVWTLELKGGGAQWSDTFSDLLGSDPRSECGSIEILLAALHPEDRVTAERSFARIAARQQSGLDAEWRVMRPLQGVRWLKLLGRVVRDGRSGPNQVQLVGVGIDVTDRKHAEERLSTVKHSLQARIQRRTAELRMANAELERQILERKRLERRLLEVSEHERYRLGQDLHDSLGQQLTGMQLLNSVLGEKLAQKSLAEAADAARLGELLETAKSETRRLAGGLQPVSPAPDGLMTALKQLAEATAKLPGLSCRFDCPQRIPIPDTSTSTHLFRIAQEAVTNALRHGKARQLRLALTACDGVLHLEIQNDGRKWGGGKPNRRGLGLHIIKARSEAIGAGLEIRAASAGGTIVHCFLPHACRPLAPVQNQSVSYTEGRSLGPQVSSRSASLPAREPRNNSRSGETNERHRG